jgi:hypothetical protein
MPECTESIEELKELEQLIPLCRVTFYEQAKARIETGVAKSVSEKRQGKLQKKQEGNQKE